MLSTSLQFKPRHTLRASKKHGFVSRCRLAAVSPSTAAVIAAEVDAAFTDDVFSEADEDMLFASASETEDEGTTLGDLQSRRALVLDSSYRPIRVVGWQRAVRPHCSRPILACLSGLLCCSTPVQFNRLRCENMLLKDCLRLLMSCSRPSMACIASLSAALCPSRPQLRCESTLLRLFMKLHCSAM